MSADNLSKCQCVLSRENIAKQSPPSARKTHTCHVDQYYSPASVSTASCIAVAPVSKCTTYFAREVNSILSLEDNRWDWHGKAVLLRVASCCHSLHSWTPVAGVCFSLTPVQVFLCSILIVWFCGSLSSYRKYHRSQVSKNQRVMLTLLNSKCLRRSFVLFWKLSKCFFPWTASGKRALTPLSQFDVLASKWAPLQRKMQGSLCRFPVTQVDEMALRKQQTSSMCLHVLVHECPRIWHFPKLTDRSYIL